MKAHIPPKSRVSKELMDIAAAEGLSPKTGARVKKRLEETVIPMWENYIQPDDAGRRDGDWAIRHKLDDLGWPSYEPEHGEM